ncbi:2-dehydro-3-deoxygluconokinase [Poriferisphaera corsica]|uniref:2-dehydro-3-deoxygluconokinase n=1 Tax=Poriferisphaera corsica TaxID=2528020 RepID=A0A517YW58_9BACT|nr:sugar kinase [Poriferisphaera corsica]QDU34412.1 2-dehydro-3-deoxygluconokinase [Poriferisphaera corsica]
MGLTIRTAESCELDLVSLGECMVRLSPQGHGRIEFSNLMELWVGGGEYNVAYALSRLGLRTGWVGGVVDNPVGKLVMNHARGGGLDTKHVVELDYDGVGRDARMGLNWTEVGQGPRASVTLYDRGHSATSKMDEGDVDWDELFVKRGVRWLHTGGIFTCLSDSTRRVAAEALKAAHDAGTMVSYDLNFRSKLWSSEEAIETTKPLVQYIDCLIGNEEDFQKVLGYKVEGAEDENLKELPIESYKKMVRRVAKDYPNLKVIGTTLREVLNANENNWSAILYWAEDDKFYHGPSFDRLLLEDRVGGGDGFASGFTYSFLKGYDPQEAVNIGTAHGALLQTTRGDTSMITEKELLHVAGGGGARIIR